jgi:hypothetical protein
MFKRPSALGSKQYRTGDLFPLNVRDLREGPELSSHNFGLRRRMWNGFFEQNPEQDFR